MSAHILHIANDFAGSTVYKQLIQSIDNRGVQQSVFTTIREEKERGKNAVHFKTKGSVIHYSDNWRAWHRISFTIKAKSNYKNLLKAIDPKTITHVHAHTLFSDGILALKLKKDFGIPYTVTIRNSDINVFMKFMVHTWRVGREVILNADKVVCISPAHIERVKTWIACPTAVFTDKVINIPNGVDEYWLHHIQTTIHSHPDKTPWQLIYVGNFTPNKNLPRLMRAILNLTGKGYCLELHIIGDRGKDTTRIETLAKRFPKIFHLYGTIRDKEKIRSVMRQCNIFTMPSLTETFGLVYVEALSQGLPILYSEKEGVDGFFPSSYGERCDPRSVRDISKKIEKILTNYDKYAIKQEFISTHFDWNIIESEYTSIFKLQLP